MCKGPGVPWGEIKVMVKKMGEMAGASPRVFHPVKRDRRFSRAVSWYCLGKTLGVGPWQGGALIHGLSGGTEAELPS